MGAYEILTDEILAGVKERGSHRVSTEILIHTAFRSQTGDDSESMRKIQEWAAEHGLKCFREVEDMVFVGGRKGEL